MILCC